MQGLFRLIAAAIKGSEEVVTQSAVWMGLNRLLIGVFGLRDLALMLISLSQAEGGIFIAGLQTEGKLEFGRGFGEVPCAVEDASEADVAGGAGVAEFDGFVAAVLRRERSIVSPWSQNTSANSFRRSRLSPCQSLDQA